MTKKTTTTTKPRSRDNKCGSEQYHAFAVRIFRMYGRRAREEQMDISALEQLADLQRELDDQTAQVVMQFRADGWSWQQIGDALGMTKAGAYKKFIARPDVADAEGARKQGGQPGHLR